MDIKKIRSSFSVSIVDSNTGSTKVVEKALGHSGFDCKSYSSPESLFESIGSRPPHILFCNFESLLVFGEQFISESLECLPELHFIIYSDKESLADSAKYFKYGVKEAVLFEEVGDNKMLISSADRAAERDYYMYKQEQFADAEPMAPNIEDNLKSFEIWCEEVYSIRSLKDSVDFFMNEVAHQNKSQEIIFFKFVPKHHSLIASQSFGRLEKNIRGLGYDFRQGQEPATVENLLQPEKIKGFATFLKKAFEFESHSLLPLVVDGVPEGIFAFRGENIINSYTKSCVQVLASRISNISLGKKLHEMNPQDETTKVLNKEHFLSDLSKEVNRARRITHPISLVLLSVDNFLDLERKLTSYEKDMLFKMIATILKRHSRVTDVVGRLETNMFALLLPHTDHLGGAVKSERVRRIFETADFSKYIPSARNVTISIGLSEYPSHGSDDSSLFEQARVSLEKIMEQGSNKVCMAQAGKNFVPEFEVKK